MSTFPGDTVLVRQATLSIQHPAGPRVRHGERDSSVRALLCLWMEWWKLFGRESWQIAFFGYLIRSDY